jgi:hypothetical protein
MIKVNYSKLSEKLESMQKNSFFSSIGFDEPLTKQEFEKLIDFKFDWDGDCWSDNDFGTEYYKLYIPTDYEDSSIVLILEVEAGESDKIIQILDIKY